MIRQDLIAKFISIDCLPRKTTFHVARILWDVHTPQIEWVKYAEIAAEATEAIKDSQIRKILSDPEYFSLCRQCGENTPVGWMLGTNACYSCAENNPGSAP
jgi:hypothetical protein